MTDGLAPASRSQHSTADDRTARLRRAAVRVVAAMLPPLAASLLQWLAWEWLAPSPWLLFFPAVFVSAWIGGLSGGLASTALSLVLVQTLFVQSQPDAAVPAELGSAVILLGSGLLFSVFHNQLRHAARTADIALRRARVNEQRFRDLLEHAPDAIFVADTQGYVTSANRSAARLIGMPADQLLGRHVTEFVVPQERALLEQLRLRLLTGQVEMQPWTVLTADGRELPVEVTTSILPDGRWQSFVRDVSKYRSMERDLRAHNERIRLLMEAVPEGILGLDGHGVCTFVNPAGLRLLGYCSAEELIGKSARAVLHGCDGDPSHCPLLRAVAERRRFEVEDAQLRRRDGTTFAAAVRAYPLPLATGDDTGGAVVLFSDVDPQRRAQEQLRQAAVVFDTTAEAIIVTDSQGNIVRVNRAYTEVTGYSPEEVIGKNPRLHQSGRHDTAFYARMWDSLQRTGQWRGEIWNRRKNGEIYPAWENISAVRDDQGRITHYVAILSDITPLQQARDRLSHLAHHDALTGLPNRLLFSASLQQALERAKRHGHRVAVLFLDLDRFKRINDTLGHAAGDRLLQEVAERLRQSVRAEDLVARLGGDEFTVLLEELSDPEHSAHLARKIIEALARPFVLDDQEVRTSTSIGIGLYPDDASDADTLMAAADTAMYRAKARGRGTFEFYAGEVTGTARERLALQRALQDALARGELEIHYQPQFDLHSGALVGVEALLRWRHPQRGLLPPSEFLPDADNAALTDALSEWAVQRSYAQAREWAAQGLRPRIGINLSPRQLRKGRAIENLTSLLARCRDDGVRIALEVPERALNPTLAADQDLARLSALGADIAVDGFGTGCSPLNLLRRLPIDTLKIDRGILRRLPDDPNAAAVTAAVISLAHQLGLKALATGVENAAQRDFLREHGCDEVQGYLFGAPMPAAALTRWLH